MPQELAEEVVKRNVIYELARVLLRALISGVSVYGGLRIYEGTSELQLSHLLNQQYLVQWI